MDRRTAAEEIKARWRELYPEDRSGKGIICPICKSGSRSNGTGISDGYGVHNNSGKVLKSHFLKCWNPGCGFGGGSVIDLYMLDRGIQSYVRAIDELAAYLHIPIDAETTPAAAASTTQNPSLISDPRQECATPAEKADYTEYYFKCRENLLRSTTAQSYLRRRGISLGNAVKNFIGYDPRWIHPKVIKNQQEKGSSWLPRSRPVIVLPSSPSFYVARDIRPESHMTERERMYKKMHIGPVDVFGWKNAIERSGASAIFVTEGAFDALAIMETGAVAVATNSANNTNALIKKLKEQPTSATLIICLDNDQAGAGATPDLVDGLNDLHIRNITADISCGCKDPNEALITDRAAFEQAIKSAMQAAEQ